MGEQHDARIGAPTCAARARALSPVPGVLPTCVVVLPLEPQVESPPVLMVCGSSVSGAHPPREIEFVNEGVGLSVGTLRREVA